MSEPASETAQSFIPALLGLMSGGTFMGLLSLVFNRKKTNAETLLIKANADDVVVGSAIDFVKELRVEATALRERAERQEKRIDILEDHVRLQAEINKQLRTALAVYNPEHHLLKTPVPDLPL